MIVFSAKSNFYGINLGSFFYNYNLLILHEKLWPLFSAQNFVLKFCDVNLEFQNKDLSLLSSELYLSLALEGNWKWKSTYTHINLRNGFLKKWFMAFSFNRQSTYLDGNLVLPAAVGWIIFALDFNLFKPFFKVPK